jgi:hypothetical protein
MNMHLTNALLKEGVTVKTPLPSGTNKSADVDALVSYTDSWRWDLIMYLKGISIRLFDAKTGDLLASGTWADSAFHGFHDAQEVVGKTVADVFEKLRASSAK